MEENKSLMKNTHGKVRAGEINNSPLALELKDTCKVQGHYNKKLEYISVNEAHQENFKCGSCIIKEKGLPISSLIDLKQIESQGFQTVYQNLPNLDATQRFYEQSQKLPPAKPLKKVEKEWNQIFYEMKDSFFVLFDQFKYIMMQRIRIKEYSINQILSKYNQMINKDQLKKIIFDQQTSIEEKKVQCKDHFSQVQKNSEENSNILEEGTKQLKILLNDNDQEFVKLFQKSVSSQLDCFINLLNNKTFNIDNFLKNKESFQPKDLKEQVNNIQQAIEPVKNNFKELLFLELKKIDQPTEIGTYFSQYQNTYKETLDPQDIYQIIQNPTNFCSPEYLNAVKKALESCGSILKLYPAPAKRKKQSFEVSLNELEDRQLSLLAQLADTIRDLNTKEKERYRNSGSPQKNIQSNSYQIMKYLRDIRPISLKDTISKLLVDFPIFEYSKDIDMGTSLPIQFIKTDKCDSQEIVLINNNLGVNFSIGPQKEGQVVSEELVHYKTYSLKVKFNLPNEQDRKVYLKMGLIEKQSTNTEFLGEKRQKPGQQKKKRTTSIIKGNLLNPYEFNSQLPELEFRWCIEKRLFFILDSTYLHINEVDYQDLSDNQDYRFTIWFNNQQQTDWGFTIMDFSEIKRENLHIFD